MMINQGQTEIAMGRRDEMRGMSEIQRGRREVAASQGMVSYNRNGTLYNEGRRDIRQG